MIVNINLLPQREKRNIAALVILVLFFIILLTTILSFYVLKQNEISRKESKAQQLAAVSAELIKQNKSQQSSDNQSDEVKLQSKVNELKKTTISSVFIIDQLTQLLPKYGLFQSLDYGNEGTVDLQVQFNEKREAIYYFARLQKQNWVKQVNLTSINEEEANNTSQSLVELINSRYIGIYHIEIYKEKVEKHMEDAK